jgi:uncharacterized protein YxeA
MAILFAGLIAKFIFVGLLGFVIALAGAFFIFTNISMGKGGKGSPKVKKAKWSDRLEGRWDRRNYDN